MKWNLSEFGWCLLAIRNWYRNNEDIRVMGGKWEWSSGGGDGAATQTVYQWRLRQPWQLRLPYSHISYPEWGQVFLPVKKRKPNIYISYIIHAIFAGHKISPNLSACDKK